MLSINLYPPTRSREKEEKGDTYKLNIKSFTNNINNTGNINNINNKRNNAKCTKQTWSFPWKLAPGGSPRLDLAADGNWTQGCTDRNLDQDCRQNKKQPWTKRARPSWSPSFKLSVMWKAWNTLLVNIGSLVLSAPPHKCDTIWLLTCRTLEICQRPWLP